MAKTDERMILRTVYLTPEIDTKLRVRAFQRGVTKSEIIREALTQYLQELEAATPTPKIKKRGKKLVCTCGKEWAV